MADDPDDESGIGMGELAVEAYAATDLALDGASRAKADAFLDEQIALVRLQKEHLHEQRGLLLSHLKWRRYGDCMRSGWQTLVAIVALAIFLGICAAVWTASQSRGLVIESFSVPPDFAARGIGGDQLAGDMMSKVATIRAFGNSHSYGTSEGVHSGSEQDVRVEIPETGVSVADVWRLLRGWFGQERHVTGDLRELADGKVALVVHVTDAPTITVAGAAADLDKIEQDAAEQVYGILDPLNHSIYLSETGRTAKGMDAIKAFAEGAPDAYSRAVAYGLWAAYTRTLLGDAALSRTRARLALAIYPHFIFGPVALWRVDEELSDPEDLLKQARTVQTFKASEQKAQITLQAVLQIQEAGRDWIAVLTGDFAHAGVGECRHRCPWSRTLLVAAVNAAQAHDSAAAWQEIGQSRSIGDAYDGSVASSQGWDAMMDGDWDAAVRYWRASLAAWKAKPPGDASPKYVAVVVATHIRPWLALSLGHLGAFAEAHREIDRTPRDCYNCVRVRGLIDAMQKNWAGAEYWFAAAVKQAPSIPFADTDWGQALLWKGDYDSAIAKFESANKKGPHFADPLEMWGEALMLKNRSDLALAKFDEADNYAPNWGRLHLKWGEALMYAGKKDEAAKQFSIAASLDLSATDRSALARVRHG